jgi:hypothetical protein
VQATGAGSCVAGDESDMVLDSQAGSDHRVGLDSDQLSFFFFLSRRTQFKATNHPTHYIIASHSRDNGVTTFIFPLN